MRVLAKSLAILATVIAGSSAGPSIASSTSAYGKVSGLYGTYNGAILFSVATTTRDTTPACAAGFPNRWAIDASTAAGQALAQTLLWAMDHHKLVYVTGTDSCTIWRDTETVAMLSVQDTDY